MRGSCRGVVVGAAIALGVGVLAAPPASGSEPPTSSSSPTRAPAVQVSAGAGWSFARLENDTVWGWGSPLMLGDGIYGHRFDPHQCVSRFDDVIAVSGGDYASSIVLRADGTAWSFGSNGDGELGDGTTTSRYDPVQVVGLTDVVAVSMGDRFSLALRADGTVWAWGDNDYGQLGDGTTIERHTPVQVSGLTDVTAISAGYFHSLAVRKDGSVWAWGSNDAGQLGDGTTWDRSTPTIVGGLPAASTVAAGEDHSMALTAGGDVWAWGANYDGQIGDGSHPRQQLTAVKVPRLAGVTAIAAGFRFSMAVVGDGTAKAWGSNQDSTLGIGVSGGHRYRPARVKRLHDVVSLSAGYEHSMAAETDGSVWTWGKNSTRQIGVPDAGEYNKPIMVMKPGS